MARHGVIQDPIINAPFQEPRRHFRFDDEGITDENLIVQVTGASDKDKAAKVATARNLWVPAVSNAGTWGRWAFIETSDPWDAKNLLRGMIEKRLGRLRQ